MNKMKEKVKRMNPKKGFCNLILCAVVFCIIAGIGTAAKFGSRIPEMKQQIEAAEKTNEEIYQNTSEKERDREENRHEKEHEFEWNNIVTLTTSDYVFVGCVMAGFWIILCIYWLYTTAYVVSKSWEVGANAWIFGILALVTNLFGVAVLWIYIKMHLVCRECGMLQPRNANYCSICGSAIYIKCPDCGSRISIHDEYCNGCGRKMRS
ncbi:hypothetical protein LAD12857_04230 [Lacrimispora amygdalina]|uniref:DZANK-type domain-containing protein n=1 Tax=Lacrimispora amygdalina TaxID=253257 RepID=A0ABQ5M1L9_9FIRM|nr:zinc ribbon domain-containing protein [Haloimpatiens lingqiaonensis]MDD4432117.1 zinc ribbon domain-containing protein [Parabacteroides sp.]